MIYQDEEPPVIHNQDLSAVKLLIGSSNFDFDHVREDRQFDEDHMIWDMKKTNETLLHRAIKCGLLDLVQLLINKGADVNIPCRYTEWKLNAPENWSDEFK